MTSLRDELGEDRLLPCAQASFELGCAGQGLTPSRRLTRSRC
jgi:hypothetical protein